MAEISNKYALLIGINRYHESLGPLKYAVNDCKRLAEVLTSGQDGFAPENVLLVTDDQPEERRPTYANIHSWLASWLSQPKDDDTVLVYFCGHGRDMGGKCYLAPGDATLQTMHVTGIPVAYVQDLLSRCNARQKLLVLDACHSGAGRDVAVMSGSMMNQIAAGKGIYTITACDADELSHEWDEKKQGVFSYYLAEALSGSCPPDSQGRITAESLYEWVHDRVRSWAANKRCSQTPKRFAEGTGSVVWIDAAIKHQNKPTRGSKARPTNQSSDKQSIKPSRSKCSPYVEEAMVEEKDIWLKKMRPALTEHWVLGCIVAIMLLVFSAQFLEAFIAYALSVGMICLWPLYRTLHVYHKWNNSYYLYAAEQSADAGDWDKCYVYAKRIKKYGVDAAKVCILLRRLEKHMPKDEAWAMTVMISEWE